MYKIYPGLVNPPDIELSESKMGSFFQVVSIVLLIVVKSRAVTDIELVYLLNTRQFTNDQVAIFQISNITSDKYVVTISGEPTFVEGKNLLM